MRFPWKILRNPRNLRQRALLTVLTVLLLLIPVSGDPAHAQAVDVAEEYEIKAAMYVNMLRLVDWPATGRGEAGAPVIVGVTGSDEMARALEAISQLKTGPSVRRIAVRRLSGAAGISDCKSVFVGGGDKKRISAVVQAVGRSPVLTVGENEKFLGLGGMIDLMVRDDRVQIEVNLELAQTAGLSISSQLLKIAVVRNGVPK
jgi:hypothetical protein